MTRFSPRQLWVLMTVGAACYILLFVFYPLLFLRVGVGYYGYWFLDIAAVLASNDAVNRGIDPYVPNPLDIFGRPHVYSDWWLGLRHLGLGARQVYWVGSVLAVAFFSAAISQLRPRSPGEVLWYLAVLCSSPVLLAIHRANNDLVIFILLLPLVPCLLARRQWPRLFSGSWVALAAGLKFYPAVAGLAILGAAGSSREKRRTLIAAALMLAVVGLSIAPSFVRVSRMVPKAEGLMTFGVVNLVRHDGLIALVAGLVFVAVAAALFLRSHLFDGWKPGEADRPDWLRFMLAASLLSGCYFISRNFAYRWIFALWLAPLLWRVVRDPGTSQRLRRFATVTALLLLVALWSDAAASMVLMGMKGKVPDPAIEIWADNFFAWEQPVIAAFFACLIGWLAHFIRQELPPLLRRGNS